jgi:hypothetical protein
MFSQLAGVTILKKYLFIKIMGDMIFQCWWFIFFFFLLVALIPNLKNIQSAKLFYFYCSNFAGETSVLQL